VAVDDLRLGEVRRFVQQPLTFRLLHFSMGSLFGRRRRCQLRRFGLRDEAQACGACLSEPRRLCEANRRRGPDGRHDTPGEGTMRASRHVLRTKRFILPTASRLLGLISQRAGPGRVCRLFRGVRPRGGRRVGASRFSITDVPIRIRFCDRSIAPQAWAVIAWIEPPEVSSATMVSVDKPERCFQV
jgi:hypothetical protein